MVHQARFFLVDQRVRFDQRMLGVCGLKYVIAGKPPDQAIAQFHDFLFTLVNGPHPNSVGRATVVFADDHVLGDIDQFCGSCNRSRLS